MAFVAMVAVGEGQVRSSPKWPPPSRHELGGWEIDPPPALYWAASLNLPATLPILWLSSRSDAFTYAFDDHQLIVYVPWTFFVCCLWYLVAYRLEHVIARQPWKSSMQRSIVLCSHAFITAEMLWAASVFRPVGASGRAAIVCFWVWAPIVVLGWVDFILRPRNA